MTSRPCKKCGVDAFRIETKLFKNGTEHMARYCLQCGAFNDYAAKEIPPGMFLMPYGKYRGSSLQQIYEMDRDYLFWLGANSGPSIRKRCVAVVAQNSLTIMPAHSSNDKQEPLL